MYIRFYRDSLAEPATDIYAFAYVSFNKEAGTWHTPAQPTRNYGSGTPMTTAATAPLRHAPMSGRPPKRGSNACAGARSYSSAGVLNTRSSIGWSTAYGPASSFPAASTESANSSRQPTTCCVGLPAARSIQAAPGQCGSAGPQRRTRGHPGARGRGAPADRTGWPTTGRLMPGRQARQLPNPA